MFRVNSSNINKAAAGGEPERVDRCGDNHRGLWSGPPHAEINVKRLILVGRFSGDPHWPVLGEPGGDVTHFEGGTMSCFSFNLSM